MSEHAARILIVDDDPSARDIVRRRLEMEGHEMLMADDGWQALEVIEQEQPDLVILDMMMPGLDGIGVIKRIRSNPAQVALPILMLTARDRAVDKQFGLESGADDYLGKPFEFPELLARVQALLRRSRGWKVPGELIKRGHVVAFAGAKGGAGTTTVAANVAVSLARQGANTILVDFDEWSGNAATLLGLVPRRRLDRLPLNRPEILTPAMIENTVLEHESGLRVLASRGAMLEPVTEEGWVALVETIRRCADVLVFDLAGVPNAQMTAAARVSSQLWIVTQPEPSSVERATALIDHLDDLGVSRRRVGLIVNTTNPVMVVPETEIARATGIEPTYTLPSMPNACYAAVSRGVPIVDLSAQLPAAQTFTTMAAAIVSRPWMLTRAHAVSSTESAEAVEAR